MVVVPGLEVNVPALSAGGGVLLPVIAHPVGPTEDILHLEVVVDLEPAGPLARAGVEHVLSGIGGVEPEARPVPTLAIGVPSDLDVVLGTCVQAAEVEADLGGAIV